jgi:hypothetical protein
MKNEFLQDNLMIESFSNKEKNPVTIYEKWGLDFLSAAER